MGEYFEPAYRKVGVFILVLACAFLAWWGRVSIDIAALPTTGTLEYQALAAIQQWTMSNCAIMTCLGASLVLIKPSVTRRLCRREQ